VDALRLTLQNRARPSAISAFISSIVRPRSAVTRLVTAILLLAVLAGCGPVQTRTVTVERPTGPEASTTAGRSELPRADNVRVARARVELRAYCAAVRRGERPPYDGEVAALVTLIAIFMRDPFARFEAEDSPLALTDVLKLEADALDDACDPKAARLLRETVDVGVYMARP
jgi:hypothetical protein